jgi:hypothetical protein
VSYATEDLGAVQACARCSRTPALVGEDQAEDVGLITDGRFSEGTYGMVVGHVYFEYVSTRTGGFPISASLPSSAMI